MLTTALILGMVSPRSSEQVLVKDICWVHRQISKTLSHPSVNVQYSRSLPLTKKSLESIIDTGGSLTKPAYHTYESSR